ncbi:MAG: copper amine oxidase N-terminal domain-containing protein [Pseudobutyrivibrio sp.]|nr:copper amine oxidase N-terminal domain-containing protein [Pseudobutyrivibrio sp.]
MKKLASLVLTLVLLLALAVPALAAQSNSQSVTLDGEESSITLNSILEKRTAVIDGTTVDVYVIPAEGAKITFTSKSWSEDGTPDASMSQMVYIGTDGTYSKAAGVFWGLLREGTFLLTRDGDAEIFSPQCVTEGVSLDAATDAVFMFYTTDENVLYYAYASDDTAGPSEPAVKKPKVVPTSQNLTVNGEKQETEIYNIDGSNYFKLRDMAVLLNGTGSQFSVAWDEASATISVTTGEAYTAVGGELSIGADKSVTAVESSQKLIINGNAVDLTAYNIGGNNFFKLRELGMALGFEVDYDEATTTMQVISR